MNKDVVIYLSSDGLVKMEAIVDAPNKTIWATQKAIAGLFGVNVSAISKHLKNIYSEGELAESMTISKKEKEKCKCLKIKHLHFVWYPEPGSNRHGLLHWCLRPARLPIPPSGLVCFPVACGRFASWEAHA